MHQWTVCAVVRSRSTQPTTQSVHQLSITILGANTRPVLGIGAARAGRYRTMKGKASATRFQIKRQLQHKANGFRWSSKRARIVAVSAQRSSRKASFQFKMGRQRMMVLTREQAGIVNFFSTISSGSGMHGSKMGVRGKEWRLENSQHAVQIII